MGGPPEHEVGDPQLFQVAQALELLRVKDLPRDRVQTEVAVHRVIKDLARVQELQLVPGPDPQHVSGNELSLHIDAAPPPCRCSCPRCCSCGLASALCKVSPPSAVTR